ncbi:MAG: flippase [Chloroflexi bacterium OHK40]
MRVAWFTAGLLVLLALAGVGALLWRRFYHDDPTNTARRVFKNSAVTFGMRLVVRGLDLVFAFVLYGLLSPEAIGRYEFAALLIVQYLGTVTEFGLGVLLTREVARDPSAARRLFGVTLALRLLMVAAAVVPAALVIGSYELLAATGVGEALSREGQQAIWVLLLTLIPSAYSGAVTALYNASERMEVPALMELITGVVSFLARIAVVLLGLGVIGLAWAAVGASTFTALVFLGLQLRSFFPPSLAWDWPMARRIVPMALPLMLNNLLGAVFFRFDTYIVRAFGGGQGDTLVAQYNLAYKVVGIAMILPPAVTFAVFPLLARRATGERAGMREAQNRTLQLLMALAFPLAMGMSVLAHELVRFFTRAEFAAYQPSVTALAILAWFLPLSFANGLLQYALIAVDRQAAITRAFLIGAAANIGANLIAIPTASIVLGQPAWGLYAAAVITILSELLLYVIFRPLLLAEGLRPPLLAVSWRPALAALAMGIAMLAALVTIPGSPWARAVVAALVAPPVYVAALWAIGGVGAAERELALRILGRAPR